MMKRRRLVFVCDAEWCGMVRNGAEWYPESGIQRGSLASSLYRVAVCTWWEFSGGFIRNSSIFPEFFHFSGILSFFLILDFFLHSPPPPSKSAIRNSSISPRNFVCIFPESGMRNPELFHFSRIRNPKSRIWNYSIFPESRM